MQHVPSPAFHAPRSTQNKSTIPYPSALKPRPSQSAYRRFYTSSFFPSRFYRCYAQAGHAALGSAPLLIAPYRPVHLIHPSTIPRYAVVFPGDRVNKTISTIPANIRYCRQSHQTASSTASSSTNF
ncbi:hypothetical protein NRC23 [Methanocella arvoryzae MRE50]|uniref:Uncharacterized protein n=1 Tax=Methanocella arvoryzae (strain DSM 22066 / NBRC 105507 / MRE50) TaxID=351160 RepID=Q0W0X5_METAR|nr:hypothetical protein NRC23 [Methanocella arvoryzae MRE50]